MPSESTSKVTALSHYGLKFSIGFINMVCFCWLAVVLLLFAWVHLVLESTLLLLPRKPSSANWVDWSRYTTAYCVFPSNTFRSSKCSTSHSSSPDGKASANSSVLSLSSSHSALRTNYWGNCAATQSANSINNTFSTLSSSFWEETNSFFLIFCK